MPETEPPLPAALEDRRDERDRLAVHFEAVIDPERAERRFPPDPEAGRCAQRRQVDVARMREYVADVEKSDRADAPAERLAQLAVQHDERVPAERKAVLVERVDVGPRGNVLHTQAIQREAADGRIAACEEALALRQLGPDDQGGVSERGRDPLP